MLGPVIVIIIFITYYLLISKKTPSNLPTGHPAWAKDLINQEESGPVANPPASLVKCLYKDQEVYYLPPRCCDIPGTLFDSQGGKICSPDGGFTGKGDGQCPDFFELRKDCLVIWQDNRKN